MLHRVFYCLRYNPVHLIYYCVLVNVLQSTSHYFETTAFACNMLVSACCMPYLTNICPWNEASLLLLHNSLTLHIFHHFRPVAPTFEGGCAGEGGGQKQKKKTITVELGIYFRVCIHWQLDIRIISSGLHFLKNFVDPPQYLKTGRGGKGALPFVVFFVTLCFDFWTVRTAGVPSPWMTWT